jgi:hypothetical protein
MENFTPKKRYNLISIFTFLVIAITFGYYYFYFVKYKEIQFHAKAFRVIENIGENVKEKHSNYYGTVEKALTHIAKYESLNINQLNVDTVRKFFNRFDVPKEIEVVNINNKYWKRGRTKDDLQDNEIGMAFFLSNPYVDILCKYKTSDLFQNTLRKDFYDKFIVLSKERKGGSQTDTLVLLHTDIPLILNKRTSRILSDTNLFSQDALVSTKLLNIEFNNNQHYLYLTPIHMKDGTTYFIGGLIEKDVFRNNTFVLGPFTLSIVIVILILLIFFLPYLKLYLISEDERLNTLDAVFSFIVLVLGSAFVFLLMISWQTKEWRSSNDQKNILNNFALQIESQLKKEITESLDTLVKFDNASKTAEQRIFTIGLDTLTNRNFKYDKQIHSKISDDKTAVFWTNKYGDQIIKWSTQTNTPRVNVSSRSYFQNVKNKKMWKDENLFADPFFMHGIISMTDGKTYMMYSKESMDKGLYADLPENFKSEIINNSKVKNNDLYTPAVVVLAKNLLSLQDLPLPANISYMLVDQKGEVLYHQTKSKILQENLLNETGYRNALISALEFESDTIFSAQYDGVKQHFYIKPVGNLPLFLVTYLNADYERITDIQSLSLANLLYLTLFFLLAFQIALYVIVNLEKPLKLHGKSLLFGWIWPDKSKNRIYKISTLFILLYIFVFFLFHQNSSIFLSLSSFSILTTIIIAGLNWFETKEDENGTEKVILKTGKNRMYFFAIAVINILLVCAAFSQQLSFWIWLGYIINIAFCIIFLKYINASELDANEVEEKEIRLSYNSFIFALVLALGFFPIIGFYIKSYNIEKELYQRSMQLSLFNQVNSKWTSNDNQKLIERVNSYNSSMILLEKKSHKSLFEEDFKTPNRYISGPEFNLIKNLRNAFDTTYYNAGSIDFMHDDPDRAFNWLISKDKSILYDKNERFILSSDSKRFTILPTNINFKLNYGYIIFIIAGFVLFCIITYKFIQYWSEKIFLLGLPHKKKKNEFEHILKTFKFIYLISLPYSGVKKYLMHLYSNAHIIPIREFENQNFIKEHTNQIEKKKSKEVILYDSDTFTEPLMKVKTNLISELVKLINENKINKIILVSNTHPSYKVRKFKKDENDDSIVLDQYLNILGHFKRVFFPFGFKPEKSENDMELKHLTLECVYEDENSWNTWKEDLIPKNDKEAGLLNIQSLSQIQYFSIWNGLEKREKFLIYDLAQDGLANYKNIKVIDNLIYKGILTYDNCQVKIFNDSFKNFILTNIDKEESLLIERETKRSGNWSNLQLPFIMVIIALFAFLFITQQDIFNDIIAWFGTAMVSLPLLLRTFASLSSFKSGSAPKPS